MNSKFKPYINRFLVFFLGILFALVLGEIFIRLLRQAPQVAWVQKGRYRLSSNIKLGYEPVPALDYHGEEMSFYDWQGETNKLGFRDYEHNEKRALGVYRILVLGDSITAGLGLSTYKDTFCGQLENVLEKTEVFNFGVSGYNTQQEVEIFKEKGLKYSPDLVIVAYCLNDRERDDGDILLTLLEMEENNNQKKISLVRNHPWLLKSALYRFIKYKIILAFRKNKLKGKQSAYYKALAEDTVEEYFSELADIAKKNNFKVLVVVFPLFEDLINYKYLKEHSYIKEICEKEKFYYLDLLSVFKEDLKGGENKLAIDIYHPSVLGHRLAGEVIAGYVEKEIRS